MHASGASPPASQRQSSWYSVRRLRSSVSRWRSSSALALVADLVLPTAKPADAHGLRLLL